MNKLFTYIQVYLLSSVLDFRKLIHIMSICYILLRCDVVDWNGSRFLISHSFWHMKAPAGRGNGIFGPQAILGHNHDLITNLEKKINHHKYSLTFKVPLIQSTVVPHWSNSIKQIKVISRNNVPIK